MSDKNYQFPSGHSVIPESAPKGQTHLEIIDDKNYRLHITSETERTTYWITHVRGKRILSWAGSSVELEAIDASEETSANAGKLKPLKLTMPGKVLAIKTKVGEIIEAGQPLVIVEAMKMENILASSLKGKVSQIHVNVGDRVESGATLVSFEPV